MRRLVILAVAIVALLLVLAQLLLPSYVEHRVEQRLVKQGGSANVQLSAFPAQRLLLRDGHSVRIRARGITTPLLTPGGSALQRLDGFGDVDVRVTAMHTGPFQVDSFALERNGDGDPYRATLAATVTASDLSAFAGGAVGGDLGAFLGGVAGGAPLRGDPPHPTSRRATA